MNHNEIDRLLTSWSKSFFTEPILIVLFFLCLLVAILNNHKERERTYFLVYFFTGVTLFVLSFLITFLRYLNGRHLAVYLETANSIFEFIEFIAFYFFFNKCLQNKYARKILDIFLISISIIFLAFFTRLFFPGYPTETLRNHSLFINALEFFFLSIMCLSYFYELLTLVPKTSLVRRPSFFIVTSTFFYSVLLIPFFVLAREILQVEESTYRILFAVHYILLAVVLIALLKAFLSKAPITA